MTYLISHRNDDFSNRTSLVITKMNINSYLTDYFVFQQHILCTRVVHYPIISVSICVCSGLSVQPTLLAESLGIQHLPMAYGLTNLFVGCTCLVAPTMLGTSVSPRHCTQCFHYDPSAFTSPSQTLTEALINEAGNDINFYPDC